MKINESEWKHLYFALVELMSAHRHPTLAGCYFEASTFVGV